MREGRGYHARVRRRDFLRGASASLLAACRPRKSELLWGVQSGDVTTNSGVVWCRSNRAGRMIVEWSAGGERRTVLGPLVTEQTDGIGKVSC
jgi:alkaline phosphatase D